MNLLMQPCKTFEICSVRTVPVSLHDLSLTKDNISMEKSHSNVLLGAVVSSELLRVTA